MAILIPESAFEDEGLTQGERRLLRRLQQHLDDSCIVWYQPRLAGARQPDIVVYVPEVGLTIYEVKDWSSEAIVRALNDASLGCRIPGSTARP